MKKTDGLILVEYSSNNSGGVWWLKDKDWYALEKAGWKVVWAWEEFIYKNDNRILDKSGYPMTEGKGQVGDRWLGTLAKYAFKRVPTISDAIKDFEKVTKQNAGDEGCNCCGAPHSFSWDGGFCSGEDCFQYIFNKVPKNLREALETLNKGRTK
jgi:hypothetical protein